ncbi:hypothetical protein SAPIO_CDS10819 [Scedosporium apiospermum]|uniref:Uncharacterized protein n=1 Tax=Pseudallescheria apiosperma TaxID=563466 RepID=A0A084FUM0_PSEDA|nr:uncharacterized protein SAPIO_CDS10819 [Scedosporium apiospermum]KEZ38782.1 hypothetical protein SAPIO_CDS10819 [Scedosporium apiospermum]
MSLLSNFTSTTTFPPFDSLPSTTSPSPSEPWYLVAQIFENMTITQPTLICRDRNSASFALTFEDRDFSLSSFKKGFTVVVRRARRTEAREEGKRGFVTVEKGEEGVRCLPGSMERVLVLAGDMGEGEGKEACGDCQVKGWTEKGHKSDCKIYKALRELDELES